jgi:hypothetical protein
MMDRSRFRGGVVGSGYGGAAACGQGREQCGTGGRSGKGE